MIVDEFEPTADENDRASNAEYTHTQDSLERVRALAKPEAHPDFDGKHCVDCGDVIPKARLALGKVRCVNCQERIEGRAALHRRS